MIFETDALFNLLKTILTTTLTLGMMISMTEFRFSGKVVAGVYGCYLMYTGISSALIISIFGFPALLNVFLLTITAPAIIITYALASGDAMKAIFNYMTQIDLCLLLTIPVAFLNGGSKILDLILRTVLLGSMLAINYFFLRRPFRQLADIVKGSWLFLALVPTAFCFLIFLNGRFPVHFTKNPWSLVLLLMIAIVMLVVYFVIFQSLNNNYKLFTYEPENEILRAQVNAMKERMEENKKSAYQAAIYRHDLRHHANLLTVMLSEKKLEEAMVYVQKLGALSIGGPSEIYCENPVVNIILSTYLERAKAQGILVDCKAVVPEKISMDEIELCTILSNLLENVIVNCAGAPPNLIVSILQNKGQLCIRIQNSFSGIVKQAEKGRYRSTKPQGDGMGLKSVGAIVRKYKGTINISHDKNTFIVDIAI